MINNNLNFKLFFLSILCVTKINSVELLKKVPYGLLANAAIISNGLYKANQLYKAYDESVSKLPESSDEVTKWVHSILKKYNIPNLETLKVKKSDIIPGTAAFPRIKTICIIYTEFDQLEKALKNEIIDADEKRYILNTMEWTLLHEIGHIISNDSNLIGHCFNEIHKTVCGLNYLNNLVNDALKGNLTLKGIFKPAIKIGLIDIVMQSLLAKHSRYIEEKADKFAISKITSIQLLDDQIKFFKNYYFKGLEFYLKLFKKDNDHQPLLADAEKKANEKTASLLDTHPCIQSRISMLEKRKLELLAQQKGFIKSKL